MKKIFTVITLVFAFTISANAQDKKNLQEKKADKKESVLLSPAEAGLKDAVAIAEFLGLNNTQKEDFARLFEMKHEVMQDANASMERKNEMSRIVGLKIAASIDSKQFDSLKANTELYNQLTSETTLVVKKTK